MKKALTIVTSALLLAGSAVCQGEIVVDAAGGGDFTKLQPAINSAREGQLIRVRHGFYDGATITKSVRLVGDPYVNLPGGGFTFVDLESPIRITGLPAGNAVLIADLARDPASAGSFRDLVIAEDCEGSINLAYTFSGNLVLNRCKDVTLYNHLAGWARIADSTVRASHCFFTRLQEPVVDLVNSQMTYIQSRSNIIAFRDERSVWARFNSRFFYTSDSRITGGNMAPIPAISTDASSKATELTHNYLSMDPQFLGSFVMKLTEPAGTSLTALGASLIAPPSETAQGELYLDPQSLALYYLGPPSVTGEATKRIPLPIELQPSRHADRNAPNKLATPGSFLLGIPVVFQAALIVDGEPVLSLPYPMVL